MGSLYQNINVLIKYYLLNKIIIHNSEILCIGLREMTVEIFLASLELNIYGDNNAQ